MASIRIGIAAVLLMIAPGGAFTASPVNHYGVVHGWPVMPDGRVLGQGAGVAVDTHGDVFVFHRAGRGWGSTLKLEPIEKPTIAVFDGRTGRMLREWGANIFAMPHGITIDRDDNVWVTDVALNQVFKFSPRGKLLLTVGTRGVAGADGMHFDKPTDVAVLADGSFYVSDGYGNSRVAKFDASGKFEFQWGAPGKREGQFSIPHGIAIDARGRVYVADRENDRVEVFDARGKFLTQWTNKVIGRPYGIALLGNDRIAIADGGEQPESGPDRSGVTVLDLDGRVIERFGRFGLYDGQFWGAHDVATDKGGNIYVVDISGQRVQKFMPR